MSISASVGRQSFEIGAPSFFKAFFSTVLVRLEEDSWGSRFPVVMRSLYAGDVAPTDCAQAISELRIIREALSAFPPASVVWDFEAMNARPPWGDSISPDISTLATYFVTSNGKDLISVLEEALATAHARSMPLLVS